MTVGATGADDVGVAARWVRPGALEVAMSRSLARATGACGLAHVVLLLAGFAIAVPAVTQDSSPEELTAFYVDGSSTAVFTGGYVQSLGLLLFLPFAAGLHRWLRDAEPKHGFAAATARMAALGYVTLSLAPAMSAAAAGVYLGHHGVTDTDLLAGLTTLRSFSYFLSLLTFAVFLAAVAVSAVPSGALPRWLSVSAGVVAGALAVSIAGAASGWADLASLAMLVWLVAASVWLLARRAQVPVVEPVRQAVD